VNVYPFIEAEKRCRRNVKRACELLKVSRAAFYAYLSGCSQRDQDDADLAAKIQAVHEESRGRYGAPRVHAELRRRGFEVSDRGRIPADLERQYSAAN
jgi:putative transposase